MFTNSQRVIGMIGAILLAIVFLFPHGDYLLGRDNPYNPGVVDATRDFGFVPFWSLLNPSRWRGAYTSSGANFFYVGSRFDIDVHWSVVFVMAGSVLVCTLSAIYCLRQGNASATVRSAAWPFQKIGAHPPSLGGAVPTRKSTAKLILIVVGLYAALGVAFILLLAFRLMPRSLGMLMMTAIESFYGGTRNFHSSWSRFLIAAGVLIGLGLPPAWLLIRHQRFRGCFVIFCACASPLLLTFGTHRFDALLWLILLITLPFIVLGTRDLRSSLESGQNK